MDLFWKDCFIKTICKTSMRKRKEPCSELTSKRALGFPLHLSSLSRPPSSGSPQGTAPPVLWPVSKYSILLRPLRTKASNFLPRNIFLSIPLLSLNLRWEYLLFLSEIHSCPVALIQPFSAHRFQSISSSLVCTISSTSSSILTCSSRHRYAQTASH